MKLEIITPNASSRGPNHGPTLTVGVTAMFNFNEKALRKMCAQKTASYSLVQDKDAFTDWYIMKNKEGAHLAKFNEKTRTAIFSSAALKKQIFESFGHSGKHRLKFILGDRLETSLGIVYPLQLIKETLDLVLPESTPYKFAKKI